MTPKQDSTPLKGVSTQDIPKEFSEAVDKNWDKLMSDSAHTEEKDSVFDDALRYCLLIEDCSISILQRKFKLGYNRAYRLFEAIKSHVNKKEVVNPLPTEGQTTEAKSISRKQK